MRLKSVWISEYKNLRDLRVAFDRESFLDIYVGKNGTGKSNFFEAVVEIFRHIYDSSSSLADIGFDYEIRYEVDGTETTISMRDDVFRINGAERKTVGQTPVPDNVLVYYSGHNDAIRRTTEKYEAAFLGRSRNWKSDEARKFINIGAEYKELLLSVMLMQPETCVARRYLCEKLGIEVSGETATLVLTPPNFTNKAVDVADPETFLWGAEGVSRAFAEELLKCIKGGYSPGEIFDREKNQYNLPIDIAMFSAMFEGASSSEVFRKFDNLKTLGMFGGLSIPLALSSGQVAKVGDFSDGQFQSVYIFAITELFRDRNCITLMDEPDAFLHPEWQFGFLSQVVDIADTQGAETNHVLLSSHSAATLISHDDPKIGFFDIKGDRVNVYSVPKHVAVKKLSDKLIKYTEKEQLLSIINAIQIENKPVFFTEGKIDPIIIKEAWNRLFDCDMPFIPFYGFGCTFLKQLLVDDDFLKDMKGLPVFGMFAFDKAYNQWNSLKGDIEVADLSRGLIKKIEERNSYGIMLPLPANEEIRRQVIHDEASNQSFGGDSLCEIEHLFFGDPKTEEFFEKQAAPGGGTKVTLKSDAQKERMASEVVPLLDDAYFEVFRPVFEFITAKCA